MTPAKHWKIQGYSAYALIPLSLWLFISLFNLAAYEAYVLLTWISQPFNAIFFVLTISIGFYHGKLGVDVILEDYIPNPKSRAFFEKTISALLLFIWVVMVYSIIQTF